MSLPLDLGGNLAQLLPIAALLPLTAILMVLQRNPYQTLVLRGILGAIATLLYALLGAADVALTEALVGTLLSTTLYAIALRSSMVFRLALTEGDVLGSKRRALLEPWLQQAFLRLEVIDAPRAGSFHGPCHGQLGGDGELLIRSGRLLEQLLSLDGARAWRQAGGTIARLSPKGPAGAEAGAQPGAQLGVQP